MTRAQPPSPPDPAVTRGRLYLLRQIEDVLELPMIVLGFIWLLLLIVELLHGLAPAWEILATIVWVAFVLDFLIKLLLAPRKLAFLGRNWLIALSLVLPALRVFRLARLVRVLRMTRAVRAVRFARVLTGLNRGPRSLRASMRQRGLGYVIGATVVVAAAGAAGMYAFEHDAPNTAFTSYASSLWWTLMLLTSIGSEAWPQTASGRTLCLLLSIYGFAVFGYITAALASYFVGRDAQRSSSA